MGYKGGNSGLWRVLKSLKNILNAYQAIKWILILNRYIFLFWFDFVKTVDQDLDIPDLITYFGIVSIHNLWNWLLGHIKTFILVFLNWKYKNICHVVNSTRTCNWLLSYLWFLQFRNSLAELKMSQQPFCCCIFNYFWVTCLRG